jgi:hypothetical protein
MSPSAEVQILVRDVVRGFIKMSDEKQCRSTSNRSERDKLYDKVQTTKATS